MPQEQEIPAPVTTTILFDLAIARDISESERLVWESVLAKSSSRVTVIVAKVKLHMHIQRIDVWSTNLFDFVSVACITWTRTDILNAFFLQVIVYLFTSTYVINYKGTILSWFIPKKMVRENSIDPVCVYLSFWEQRHSGNINLTLNWIRRTPGSSPSF